jgi:hypothetical protein
LPVPPGCSHYNKSDLKDKPLKDGRLFRRDKHFTSRCPGASKAACDANNETISPPDIAWIINDNETVDCGIILKSHAVIHARSLQTRHPVMDSMRLLSPTTAEDHGDIMIQDEVIEITSPENLP